MLQHRNAAICCAIILISSALSDDVRWNRQAKAETEAEKRLDDWVPVTDPCPTCKRQLIGEQRPGQLDDISSLLTPPGFGKPRNLAISNQDVFLSSIQKEQNSVKFPTNKPLSLRQANSFPNFLQQGQQNPFVQEQKTSQFFSSPVQSQQPFSFQQAPFFITPQSLFPIPSQPHPQFNFVQQQQHQTLNGRPQPLPTQNLLPFNNKFPSKGHTFPGVATPVNIGALQNNKEEEVQLLYVPVETLQKNKIKDNRPFGKQTAEKAPGFQVTPTFQSVIKDQRFNIPAEQLNQREPKQNFNALNQFTNPSSFQFQQIGDVKFNNGFEQKFRHPGFQSFPQPPIQAPPTFIRNENQNRFEFDSKFIQQQSAVPSKEIKQTSPSFTPFNQFVSQTPPPTVPQTASTLSNEVQQTPLPSQNPPPHQPPLAVYMEKSETSKVTDVLTVLKSAKTIPVLDQVEESSPVVFVGPSSLDPPKGYVKFELPYLSSLESNRIERKVANLPFFVAPLNFKPPAGYSKIPFPAPHIGSVVISNSTILKEVYEKPSTTNLAFTSFDYTTQSSSPLTKNYFHASTKINEIPSSTSLPFETTPTVAQYDFTQSQKPSFETSPGLPFGDLQFTGKPSNTPQSTFSRPNFEFTQPPASINQQPFEDKIPQLNINRPQVSERNPEQFKGSQADFNLDQTQKSQFNVLQTQFETRPHFEVSQPQFSAGRQELETKQPQFNNERPELDLRHPQFNTQPNQQFSSVQQQFDQTPPKFDIQPNQFGFGPSQFEVKRPEFDKQPRPQFEKQPNHFDFDKSQYEVKTTQFEKQPGKLFETSPSHLETKQPQFEGKHITYEFEKQRFDVNSPKESNFPTKPQLSQFETQSSFGAPPPQFNNEQQAQVEQSAPVNTNAPIQYQFNTEQQAQVEQNAHGNSNSPNQYQFNTEQQIQQEKQNVPDNTNVQIQFPFNTEQQTQEEKQNAPVNTNAQIQYQLNTAQQVEEEKQNAPFNNNAQIQYQFKTEQQVKDEKQNAPFNNDAQIQYQFNTEQQVEDEKQNAPVKNNAHIKYQEQTSGNQNNEFSTQNNDQRVVPQQFQYDQPTESHIEEPISTTVYIPRRKSTTPRQQYKSSTPPPNYNPRKNRKPLYRGIPKNSGEIHSTTISSNIDTPQEQNVQYALNSNFESPTRRTQRPIFTTEKNPFENSYEDDNFKNSFQTLKPNQVYQPTSAINHQSQFSDNTVIPSIEQNPTESYPKTEKIETSTTFTQQTPNYSNFQGINQFFNQVIQQENIIPQEISTVANEPVNTITPKQEQSIYSVQQSTTSETPVLNAETTSHTEITPQQSITTEQEYTRKPNLSEKRNRYRQKLQQQNTANNFDNTPVYDNVQKDVAETEKPLRSKNKYRNRQRLAGRGQYRTSTSTEAAQEENIAPHFSSIRNPIDNVNNQATDNFENNEFQSTSTEQASTKIDVGKYGTFKRRRPGKFQERTTSSTETSNGEYETIASTARTYRTRTRTTSSIGEKITRHRVRRPLTSTTSETPSTVSSTESPNENGNVDWGNYVNNFSPSAQSNDILGSIDDQNRILKTEENVIDQGATKDSSKDYGNTQYSIEKSQSYEITTTSPNIDPSPASSTFDQVSYPGGDEGAVSQFETRKFSAKKLQSGFIEFDNMYAEGPPLNSYDGQLDAVTASNVESRNEEQASSYGASDDKSILKEKENEPKKVYDPNTGKKSGGRRRGQWVRVRVKKPNQEYFETAESQNVANLGNTILNPTKPSFPKTSPEELLYIQSGGKQQTSPSDYKSSVTNRNVYFTSTTETIPTTTTEDSPAKFDLEKGVSAMIAEFMSADEDESKDNAQEIVENVETKVEDQPASSAEENINEKQEVEVYGSAEKHNEPVTTPAAINFTDASGELRAVERDSFVNIKPDYELTNDEQVENGKSDQVNEEQEKNPGESEKDNQYNPVTIDYNQQTQGSVQTQFHENFNEESEHKESQLKEREIKNSNYEYSNHKYEGKGDETESQSAQEHSDEISEQTPASVQNIDKPQGSLKENVSVDELREVTTNLPESDITTEEDIISTTATEQAIASTTHSKVFGTSTTTEISLETEICYKGRCIKSKKKRPAYQKDLFNLK